MDIKYLVITLKKLQETISGSLNNTVLFIKELNQLPGSLI